MTYTPLAPRTRSSFAEEAGSGTSASTSEDSDEGVENERISLSQDVYTFALVASLKRGFCHHDSIRAILLVVLAQGCQVLAVFALSFRSFGMILDMETVLNSAKTSRFISKYYAGSPLAEVCGTMKQSSTALESGYGIDSSWTFDWSTMGIMHTTIQEYIWILGPSFTLVFWLMLVVWIQRCLSDLRRSYSHLVAFMRFGHVKDPSEAFHPNDEKVLVGIQPKVRRLVIYFYVVKLLIGVCMTINGYWLLLTTTKVVDLVLNAMALEFVFCFGELIVSAILDAREVAMMSIVGDYFHLAESKLELVSVKKGKTPLKKWRVFAWCRLMIVLFLPTVLLIPRWFILAGLFRRSLTLCVTRGATDGLTQMNVSSNDIIFPVPGFCETQVENYVTGKPRTLCKTTRVSKTGQYTNGVCNSVGDLSNDRWSFGVDPTIADVCASFYFGSGTLLGDEITALHAPYDNDQPLVFGCRNEDFVIEKIPSLFRDIFHSTITSRVSISCARPAFGPHSGTKDSGILPSTYYFKDDPRSPIEHQVGACDNLKSVSTCFGSDCDVSVETIHGRSCDTYCQDAGLVCSAAFTEVGVACHKGDPLLCDQIFRTHSGICQCQLPPEKRQCALLQAERRLYGDPCQVLVPKPDSADEVVEARDCNAYCATASLRCIRQYEIFPYTELIDTEKILQCADRFTVTFGSAGGATRVCECG
eukprot:TRINITY_DN1318_c0_g2_i4.p1 TRINITY_DN1318_c0_g2~~TRINITY_DN1318_c0_g2_i4.p1  ORF type:complete len:701 (-),score=82.88 TRINITY_DN1318_c0_g2_i4:297-2399(-)